MQKTIPLAEAVALLLLILPGRVAFAQGPPGAASQCGLTHCTFREEFEDDEETDVVPLFDGRSFAGWEGNLDVFRIENGVIIGGSMDNPVTDNEYLCTKKRYDDFELRLKFRIVGENTNAGIQIRSDRVPDSPEMVGYQADVGQKYWGCLYCERRHKLLVGPTTEEQDSICNKEGWNDYVIRCQGRRIQLWVNGQRTVDYTESNASIPLNGVIGLQIHRGPPAEAHYKDIQIRELPKR